MRLCSFVRAGIGIRVNFEKLVAKLDLLIAIRRENILISRLIAARSALIHKKPHSS